MCLNVDGNVTIDLEIDQLSCTESKNCPNKTDLVPTKVSAGACKGKLTPISNKESEKSVVIPFN